MQSHFYSKMPKNCGYFYLFPPEIWVRFPFFYKSIEFFKEMCQKGLFELIFVTLESGGKAIILYFLSSITATALYVSYRKKNTVLAFKFHAVLYRKKKRNIREYVRKIRGVKSIFFLSLSFFITLTDNRLYTQCKINILLKLNIITWCA